MTRAWPFAPVGFDAPVGAVVAAQAHALGLPDLGALCGMIRWGNEPSSALRHHQERGDLGEVLVLHLVSGASPRDIGRLACRWCERIPLLGKYPATRRLLMLAQAPDPDLDMLLELARTLLRADAPGQWTNAAVAHAVLLVCRNARIGAAEHAWRCGRALENILGHQLGALAARGTLVALAQQDLGGEEATAA